MLGFEICLTAVWCCFSWGVFYEGTAATARQVSTVRWTDETRQCGSCYHSHSQLCNTPLSLAYFGLVMQTYFRD